MKRISLAQQIEELERERSLRVGVYRRAVSGGSMRLSVAEFHQERLAAAIETLRWLQANEADVRGFVAARRQADAESVADA
jgi:hypothetical protein